MISPALDQTDFDGFVRAPLPQAAISTLDWAQTAPEWPGSIARQTPFTFFDLGNPWAYDYDDISAACAGTESTSKAVTAGRGLDGERPP
jgi:hypothetical protein